MDYSEIKISLGWGMAKLEGVCKLLVKKKNFFAQSHFLIGQDFYSALIENCSLTHVRGVPTHIPWQLPMVDAKSPLGIWMILFVSKLPNPSAELSKWLYFFGS